MTKSRSAKVLPVRRFFLWMTFAKCPDALGASIGHVVNAKDLFAQGARKSTLANAFL
jgi:hypothetical protein